MAEKPRRILVVDDEPNARSALREILMEDGFEVQSAADGEQALEVVQGFAPDVALVDVRMPRMDGFTLLERLADGGFDVSVVMVTAQGSIEDAVRAMELGAENYLEKPLNLKKLNIILKKVLDQRDDRKSKERLLERVRETSGLAGIVGASEPMQTVYELIRKAAPSKATVLILGESGTGKELVAQAIHDGSPRADGPFVKVNCASLPESLLESELFGHEKGAFTGAIARREGRFELADGGTLFLDEIGEIPPSVQVRLLRFLQSREFDRVGGKGTLKVDVRVVAATNRDLAAEVKAGRFREDLYYRLNVVQINMPALRQRKSDLPALADHFARKYGEAYGKKLAIGRDAMNSMVAYDWPGNVRELENAVERAVVLCTGNEITGEDLPPLVPDKSRAAGGVLVPGASMAEIEKDAILRTLEMWHGSTTRAAETLGISVRTIQYRLKEYGIHK